jgi:hypothetical protein
LCESNFDELIALADDCLTYGFTVIKYRDAFKRTKLGYHWHFICEENSFKNRVSLLVAGFDDNGPQLYQV